MNTKERIWWEQLADQYEEWAEDPPKLYSLFRDGRAERLTCGALRDAPQFGFVFYEPSLALMEIWRYRYGVTSFPAGHHLAPDRPELRFEFCHWMADTIREYLETGKGPWETE